MALDTFDVVMIDIRFVYLHAGGWGLNLSVSHALSAYLFLRVRLLPVCGLYFCLWAELDCGNARL